MNTTFEEFNNIIHEDKRAQGLDAGNIKLTFNSVCKNHLCFKSKVFITLLKISDIYCTCFIDFWLNIS